MNQMKVLFQLFSLTFFSILFMTPDLTAQGCVAIRGISGCSGSIENGILVPKGEFLVGTNFRYFKSFRHFRGSHEEAYRLEAGTEVINKSSFLDLSLTYGISDRWYANAVLPFVHHTRTSMYEHGGNPPNGLGERHETRAAGLADVRLGIGYWLFNPKKQSKFNYALGLGVKLPTGDYEAMDLFYNQGPDRNNDEVKVVDQSIQPGDGGFGIAADLQGYHMLGSKFILVTNLFYLSNPQETNGVSTRNGRLEFSCPDQFAVRTGAFYMTNIPGLSAFLGARMEGVTAIDLIGSSAGYRRPGYAVSAEPGIGYNVGNAAFNLTVPVAIYRNRIRSYDDKERTERTGEFRHGDAAFADYLVNFSFTYRIGKKGNNMKHVPKFEETITH